MRSVLPTSSYFHINKAFRARVDLNNRGGYQEMYVYRLSAGCEKWDSTRASHETTALFACLPLLHSESYISDTWEIADIHGFQPVCSIFDESNLTQSYDCKTLIHSTHEIHEYYDGNTERRGPSSSGWWLFGTHFLDELPGIGPKKHRAYLAKEQYLFVILML